MKGLAKLIVMDIKQVELNLQQEDDIYLQLAAYHISQAIEKELKFLLELNGYEYPKTHKIDILCEMCDKYNLKYPIDFKEKFDIINEWYTKTMCDSDYTVSRMSISKSLNVAIEFFRELLNSVGETSEF